MKILFVQNVKVFIFIDKLKYTFIVLFLSKVVSWYIHANDIMNFGGHIKYDINKSMIKMH